MTTSEEEKLSGGPVNDLSLTTSPIFTPSPCPPLPLFDTLCLICEEAGRDRLHCTMAQAMEIEGSKVQKVKHHFMFSFD